MCEGFALGQLVEGGVRERSRICAELTEDGHGSALVEPAQHCGGPLVVREVVIEGVQLGPDFAAFVGEQGP